MPNNWVIDESDLNALLAQLLADPSDLEAYKKCLAVIGEGFDKGTRSIAADPPLNDETLSKVLEPGFTQLIATLHGARDVLKRTLETTAQAFAELVAAEGGEPPKVPALQVRKRSASDSTQQMLAYLTSGKQPQTVAELFNFLNHKYVGAMCGIAYHAERETHPDDKAANDEIRTLHEAQRLAVEETMGWVLSARNPSVEDVYEHYLKAARERRALFVRARIEFYMRQFRKVRRLEPNLCALFARQLSIIDPQGYPSPVTNDFLQQTIRMLEDPRVREPLFGKEGAAVAADAFVGLYLGGVTVKTVGDKLARHGVRPRKRRPPRNGAGARKSTKHSMDLQTTNAKVP